MPECQNEGALAPQKMQAIQRNARLDAARQGLQKSVGFFGLGGKLALRRTKSGHVEWLKPTILASDPAFIDVNQDCYRVLHVESDSHPADDNGYCAGLDQSFFVQHGLQEPNCVCQTKRGFHAFWLLSYPVSHKSKATAYFLDVRKRIIQALGCDSACNAKGTVRSPFHNGVEHTVRWFHFGACELVDLDVFCGEDHPHIPAPASPDDDFRLGNRNHATFRAGLRLFRASRGRITFDQLLAQLNAWQAQQSAPSLAPGEVRAIASSVLRNGPKYGSAGHKAHRPGLLRLPKLDWAAMTPEARREEIRRRQSFGGAFTSSARKKGTLQRLAEAAAGIPEHELSPRILHEASGVSLRTCQRHFASVASGLQSVPVSAPNAHRDTSPHGQGKAEGFPPRRGLPPAGGHIPTLSPHQVPSRMYPSGVAYCDGRLRSSPTVSDPLRGRY